MPAILTCLLVVVVEAFDLRTKPRKLRFDALVPAIDMVDTIDNCLATRYQCGKDEEALARRSVAIT